MSDVGIPEMLQQIVEEGIKRLRDMSMLEWIYYTKSAQKKSSHS